jgi:hypothetical protein
MVEDLATTLRGEVGKGDFGDLGAGVRGTEESHRGEFPQSQNVRLHI